jgi:hypothetical protein
MVDGTPVAVARRRERALTQAQGQIAERLVADQLCAALPHAYRLSSNVNGQVDDAGRTIGLAAGKVSEPPSDVTVCDSIRRFEGLDRVERARRQRITSA